MEFFTRMRVIFFQLLCLKTIKTLFVFPLLDGPPTEPCMGLIPRPHWQMLIYAQPPSFCWTPRRVITANGARILRPGPLPLRALKRLLKRDGR